MRLYAEEQEESLHLIRRARAWRDAGFIAEGQRAAVERRADPGLRRTGVFFRGLLFVFTAVCVQAVFGLALWTVRLNGRFETAAACLLFGGLCYFAAEREVRIHGLYRHGVEEALAVMSVGWIVAGIFLLFVERSFSWRGEAAAVCLLVAVGGGWVHARFGYLYAALAALAALAVLPFLPEWSEAWVRGSLAVMFLSFLYASVKLERDSDGEVRREARVFLQGVLVLGVYLSVNVRLPSLGMTIPWVGRVGGHEPEVSRLFYWASYAGTWAAPAALVAGGFLRRRRVFLDLGLLTGALTLATNKDYWGLKHQVWDPAVFGLLLVAAAAVASRRWKGRRAGPTADDVWKPRRHGLELAAMGVSALAPAPQAPADGGAAGFGGGASGGGGASQGF